MSDERAARQLSERLIVQKADSRNPSSESQRAAGDGQHGQSVVLVSDYSSESNSYKSRRLIGGQHGATRRADLRHGSSQQISHALASGIKRNYLFAYILLLNLLMSVANTILLCILVKSVQMSDLGLLTSSGSKVFTWNGQLNGVELNAVASSIERANSTLSVQSVESFENKPLVISSPLGLTTNHRDAGQILIAANENENEHKNENANENEPDARLKSNRIIINPSDERDKIYGANLSPLSGRPVEIVTNNLVLDQVTNEALDARNQQTVSGRAGKQLGGEKQQQKQQQVRRLLEFDGGERQSIVLPVANQIDLFPGKASALTVHDELQAQQSELTGTLDGDFDIQTRHGNLTCESREALRLISRSSRLNLVARRALTISAPLLKLDATRLHLAEGLEYLEDVADWQAAPVLATRTKESNAEPEEHNESEATPGLQAHSLMLIDGQLMALANDS